MTSPRTDDGVEATTPALSTNPAGAWPLFAVVWAGAVLFHLAGNTRLAPNEARWALGLTAVAVLARPRDPRVAVPLSVAVLANVWFEAPILGNHWLLHGFLALVVLGAVAASPSNPVHRVARLLGPARLVLLSFYPFAAVAKLNEDFFDPAVSSATFYLRESAASWGAEGVIDRLGGSPEQAVPILVAAVELSVPVLLVLRRTRLLGVLVALVFHFALALDRSHQFFDFSSILLVFFVLFLPAAHHRALRADLMILRNRITDVQASSVELARWTILAGCALVTVVAAGPDTWPAPPVLRSVGVFVWILYGLAWIVLVGRAVRVEGWATGERLLPVGTSRLLLMIPLVGALNGVTPYLEVKSGTGWNMYSNLAVVDGDTNHLIVPGLTSAHGAHSRLVRITATSDPSLRFYIQGNWLLPEVMLVDHLAARDATVEGLVDGERITYRGGSGGGRADWEQKFRVFRAVPGGPATPCQPSFGPAR